MKHLICCQGERSWPKRSRGHHDMIGQICDITGQTGECQWSSTSGLRTTCSSPNHSVRSTTVFQNKHQMIIMEKKKMWFDRSTGRMWPTGRRLAITVYRIKNHPEGDGVTCQVNEIHFHFSSQGAEEGWTSVIEIYLSIIWPAGASTLIHSVKITSGWQCQLMEKENKKKKLSIWMR